MLLGQSVDSFASKLDIDKELHKFKHAQDISFDIISNEINELLSKHFKGSEQYTFTAHKYKDSVDVDLGETAKVPVVIQTKLKSLLKRKVELVFVGSFVDWLSVYDFVEKQGSWSVYADSSGVLDSSKIKIRFGKNKLEIIEKRSIGTVKTVYDLMKTKWSNNKYVINKVLKTTYEGTQTVKVKTIIKYQKQGDAWLPIEIYVNTTQNLLKTKADNVTRDLVEIFKFSNFKIDKQTGIKWFTSKSKVN